MIEPSLDERFVTCPFCWESVSLLIDGSVGNQEYVEDCEVCCRPMRVSCTLTDAGELAVHVERET